MGQIQDDHDGVVAETRRESFLVHFGSQDIDAPSPEFLYSELDDLEAALSDVRNSDGYLNWLRNESDDDNSEPWPDIPYNS